MEKINTLTQPAKKKFRHGYSLERREKQVGFLFAIPSIIGFLLFVLLPILGIFLLSFYKVDLMSGSFSFEGLKYYSKMIHEEDFWKSVQNTGIYLVIYVPLTLVLGLTMALILGDTVWYRC